jgi:GNAT superfamily N-acetyltransferase
MTNDSLEFHSLTPDRWADFEQLFGPRGATGGCWCMWWRLKRSEFDRQKGEGNRQAFEQVVSAGEIPGLLAYAEGQAVGWCAIAPRENYPFLERSRTLKRVDEEPVWSITCFFVAKPFRRQGVTLQLIKAAVDYARGRGATIVEAYPVEPKSGEMPVVFAYTGFAATFRKAGFVEAARRSETRPLMRYSIHP